MLKLGFVLPASLNDRWNGTTLFRLVFSFLWKIRIYYSHYYKSEMSPCNTIFSVFNQPRVNLLLLNASSPASVLFKMLCPNGVVQFWPMFLNNKILLGATEQQSTATRRSHLFCFHFFVLVQSSSWRSAIAWEKIIACKKKKKQRKKKSKQPQRCASELLWSTSMLCNSNLHTGNIFLSDKNLKHTCDWVQTLTFQAF